MTDLHLPRKFAVGPGRGGETHWISYPDLTVGGKEAVCPVPGDHLYAPMRSGKVKKFEFVGATLAENGSYTGTVRYAGLTDMELSSKR